MLFLYFRIYRETEKRQRDLSQLQAGKKDSSRRSNSSDEAVDVEEWKRMRAESCICPDHLERASSCPVHSRQSVSQAIPQWCSKRWRCMARLCRAFVGFCRVDRDAEVDDDVEGEEEHVSPGCATPASVETPLQSSVSRCVSLNVIRDPLAQTPTRRNDSIVSPIQNTQAITHKDAHSITSEGSNGKLPASESVYTILIRIPGELEANQKGSIRMIQEPGPLPPPVLPPQHQKVKLAGSAPETGSATVTDSPASGSGVGSLARRPSSAVPPLNARVVPKPLTTKGSTGTLSSASVLPVAPPRKKKKKNQEKKQEKKAAKTLSAILLAFIVTWTPYNVLVLIKTIMVNDDAIPEGAWDAAYFLCYLNSTTNPMLYALCNASFRRTYIRILTCKWDNSRRQALNRGYYN
ncbi:Muscarinic acetylcholine receptor DM1 [Folsomia candida]|uniref:Muscarinic acetylcholine receptor DM1 n=2 Tax=Folsomia candida TaxID=158441 RepID=A0A226EWU4_FOLCA|nr:Muscarinic acetylcholine receptor DM1 [Folsomia candida]